MQDTLCMVSYFLSDNILDWCKQFQSLCFTHTGHTVHGVLPFIWQYFRLMQTVPKSLFHTYRTHCAWCLTCNLVWLCWRLAPQSPVFFPKTQASSGEKKKEEAVWQRYNLRQAVTAGSTCTHDSTYIITSHASMNRTGKWIPVPVTGECEQQNTWAAIVIFITLNASLLAFFS